MGEPVSKYMYSVPGDFQTHAHVKHTHTGTHTFEELCLVLSCLIGRLVLLILIRTVDVPDLLVHPCCPQMSMQG